MWAIVIQLSQAFQMERVMGIEPTSSAWKAEVLPLNYTRLLFSFQRLFYQARKKIRQSFVAQTTIKPSESQNLSIYVLT
jgi:hypothetical protein